MASYYGEFKNPVQVGEWRVASRPCAVTDENPEGVEYFVEVFREEEREIDGVSGTFSYWKPHTSTMTWVDQEDCYEWIEAMEQRYEDDYDQYLEENHDSIVQMERYEMWRNEY